MGLSHLERHKLVVWFWSPRVDFDTVSQRDGKELDSFVLHCRNTHTWWKGSFPAGTPGNGVLKVILTVGTAFPGTQ